MDKRLILAVAGSGKTSLIVSKLNLDERFLLITYTINNTRNLKKSIVRKFGHLPPNIELFSYYNFLYSFCFRPYLGYKMKPKGILWKPTPKYTDKFKLDNPLRYMTKDRILYHNRIAKLLEQCGTLNEINKRLVKYYDHLYIDEVQDFAGHDFNLLMSLVKSEVNILLVGDFYQHTFDTSRDGKTNSTLHNDIEKYQERFMKQEIEIDKEYLNKSYRCARSICNFISSKLGIKIESHKTINGTVKFVNDKNKIEEIFSDDSVIKLFYRENYKYQCYSRNWGDCKGENHYKDVCVVLNQTTMKHFEKEKLSDLKPVTKNKLYVACSRANGNLYFIDEKKIKHYKK